MSGVRSPSAAYKTFAPLRAVCETIADRMMLGAAIKRGWSAEALLDLSSILSAAPSNFQMSPEQILLEAIEIGAARPASSLPIGRPSQRTAST